MKIKRIGIDTYRENVAYLSRACPLYRAEEFQALAKIEVHGNGRTILASLNIVEAATLLAPDEIGLSEQAFATLALPEGHEARISHATAPASLDAVRAKIQGRALDRESYTAIIRDIAAHRYSKMEIAAFLIAAAGFMTTEEVLALTRAMADAGNHLHWDTIPIVDKHCIGGIPGNRTSMIVVPIVAAHGLTIPKTSSRAITSPAGTADTMQVLARVEIGLEEMREIVARVKGCLVWGGQVNLSPADDVLISVERPLGIDTREQMVASILSKKLAAGSTHLVIDIPVGPTAKVRAMEDAVRLRKLFEHIGDAVGLEVAAVMTDGSQPIGNGIGPALEARDVLRVLEKDPRAPQDLRDRALLLAGHVLEIDGGLRGGRGFARAQHLLDSGAARRKMQEIIEAQGEGSGDLAPAPLVHDVRADADGTVAAIDCFRIARIARLAGAPLDPGSGVDLFCKLGARVERGQSLYRIHARYESDFAFAKSHAQADDGYAIGALR